MVLLVTLLSFYFFFKKPYRFNPPKIAEETKRMVVVKDAIYSTEKDGTVNFTVRAKLARKYLERDEIEMEGIEGTYLSGRRGKFHFKGEKGIIDTAKKRGTIYGFTASILDEYLIKIASVSFDLKDALATSEDRVYIEGERLMMQGIGIKGDLRNGRFTLLRSVSGLVRINDDGYSFQSNTFTYDRTKSMYTLSGKVKVLKSDTRIRCDTMHVYMDKDRPKRLEAIGSAEMFSNGTVAKSERAVYDFSQKRIFFLGNAYVKRDDLELKGEKIEYDLERGSFITASPKMKMFRSGF
ncbi:MAG: LPS export ABC transporter periplasmic protein LptC [Deltaproteobacteria bacterium]|nr:LPS export ABC transporter periplasmic protein LptC [Deltaproteobacteria bacterium]